MEPCELCGVATTHGICEGCCCVDCANDSRQRRIDEIARQTREDNMPAEMDRIIAAPTTTIFVRWRTRAKRFFLAYGLAVILFLFACWFVAVVCVAGPFLYAYPWIVVLALFITILHAHPWLVVPIVFLMWCVW